MCTNYVYFVDRCSSFVPCSFDHFIVCTAYDYFVDRCSSYNPCSFDQGPLCVRIMIYFVDRKPYTQCLVHTTKD